MNEIMEYSKFMEIVYGNCDSFVIPYPPSYWSKGITTYGNRRVILRDDGTVLLHERCEYCGMSALDEKNNCASCGAVPSGKFVYVSNVIESEGVPFSIWDDVKYDVKMFFDKLGYGIQKVIVDSVLGEK